VITNTWGMHHEPKRFPDPNKFIPERYADFPLSAPEYAAMSGDDSRDHCEFSSSLRRLEESLTRAQHADGYGWGRRICVGLHIAERSMYVALSLRSSTPYLC
jgi:cytochrome P450